MKKHQRILQILLLAILIVSIEKQTTYAKDGVPLLTTGVYVGMCGDIATAFFLPVPLYGLGNTEDPFCNSVQDIYPLPVSFSGFFASLYVNSTCPAGCQPTSITLYVNGKATALGCTISESSQVCHDTVHKIAVKPNDTFTVLANCVGQPQDCAHFLQVTLDRKQPLGM